MGLASRLLLIEDDAALRSSLRLALGEEDFEVLEAGTGRDGLAKLTSPPDAALLDLGLPDIDGVEVCRQIRAAVGIPIIVVTARTGPEHVAAAFGAGADDYLPKPFAVRDLTHRVRALLQPPCRPEPEGLARDAGLALRPEGDVVVMEHGRCVPLTRTEFRLLCELAAQPTRPIAARELLRRVWGRDSVAVLPALEARITSPRHALDAGDAARSWIMSAGGGLPAEGLTGDKGSLCATTRCLDT